MTLKAACAQVAESKPGVAFCDLSLADDRPLGSALSICNRADLMYGIVAVHEGHAYIGMVEGLPREISEVIHHTYGCIGFSRTA